MKQSKEQLLIELTKIRESHAGWVVADETRRKDFAQAFEWTKQKSQWDSDRVPVLPTWSQIMVEIGKLKACAEFRDYEGNISELECKLEDLEKRLLKNVNPNL